MKSPKQQTTITKSDDEHDTTPHVTINGEAVKLQRGHNATHLSHEDVDALLSDVLGPHDEPQIVAPAIQHHLSQCACRLPIVRNEPPREAGQHITYVYLSNGWHATSCDVLHELLAAQEEKEHSS